MGGSCLLLRASVLQNWGSFAQLAYPAATMKCAESWAFTTMTLAASLQSAAAAAAVGVAYNVYGVLFIVFCVSPSAPPPHACLHASQCQEPCIAVGQPYGCLSPFLDNVVQPVRCRRGLLHPLPLACQAGRLCWRPPVPCCTRTRGSASSCAPRSRLVFCVCAVRIPTLHAGLQHHRVCHGRQPPGRRCVAVHGQPSTPLRKGAASRAHGRARRTTPAPSHAHVPACPYDIHPAVSPQETLPAPSQRLWQPWSSRPWRGAWPRSCCCFRAARTR
jgi:hypothetical protein